MPNVSVQFGGQTLNVPGAYYTDNVDAANQPNIVNLPPLIFIGNGFGGKPKTPVTFGTLEDGQALMRGGPAASYLPFMFNPSSQVNGASQVVFINAASNTQATQNLLDANNVAQVILKTTDYGAPSNLMQSQISAGSLQGFSNQFSYLVKVALFDGVSGQSVVQDNLGIPICVAYRGSAPSGMYAQITGTIGAAAQLILSSPNIGESLSVPLGPGNYATIADVANVINGSPFWSANVLSVPDMPSQLLDINSNIPLVPMAATSGLAFIGASNYAPIPSMYNSIVFWINQHSNGMATASLGTSGGGFVGLAWTPLLQFSGGTNVPPTNSDYATALNAALAISGWVVFCDSNSAAVQALLAQHVVTASSIPNRKYRRGITGSSIGDGATAAGLASQGINTKQMTYCFPGIQRTDPVSGVNTLYGGLYLAAACAGIMCGNDVAMPLTHKVLSATGLEVSLNATQIGALQNTGVLVAYIDDQTGLPTIASDVTTWQTDSNPENVFNQQIAVRQYLAYGFVQAMQPYTGTIASPILTTIQRNAAKTFLNSQVRGAGSVGVLSSWDSKSLKLVYNGQQQLTAITVNVTFVGQNRFTEIQVNVQPLNFTI